MPSPHTSRVRPPAYDAAAAIKHLRATDPKLGKLIAKAGPFTLRLAAASPFEALAEAIVYQQLHGKAAATIHRRMIESFAAVAGTRPNGDPIHPSPQHLLDCPNQQLCAAGLSANKQLALRDLAARSLADPCLDGSIPTLATIRRMSDAEIIERLTAVRGIGKWTVEMFLIFRLGRPNILPVDDYGIRKGFALTFLGLKPTDKVTPQNLATKFQIEARAKKHKWSPYCSIASWYLWRACDLAKPTLKS